MNIWPPGFCKVNLRLTLLSAQLLLVCLVLPSSDTVALHLSPLAHPVGIFALFLEHSHAPSALPQPALNREQQTGEWQSVEGVFVHAFHPAPLAWGNKETKGSKEEEEKKKCSWNIYTFVQIYAHLRWFILLQGQSDKMLPRRCFYLKNKGFICHLI